MTWVEWACDMLAHGHNTEHLIILAGERGPFNQFEMQALSEKVLEELGLDYSNQEDTIRKYACFLIDKCFDGNLTPIQVLTILKDIYVEIGMEKYLDKFWLLYFAKIDLSHYDHQWYWPGANRENIDTIISEYFTTWRTSCMTDEKTTVA
jgi:hypothetical protein